MATQTKKKSTTKTAKRKPAAKKGQKKAAEGFPFKNEIIAIVCLALTLFVIVSVWFSSGGTIGNALSNLLRGLFGDVAFLIPLALISQKPRTSHILHQNRLPPAALPHNPLQSGHM